MKERWKDYLHIKGSYQGAFYCPVCDSHPNRFYQETSHYFEQMDKYQCIHSIYTLETANFLHNECKKCHSTDRDRLYALYLKETFKSLEPNGTFKFIDFAPSCLSGWMRANKALNYRSADIAGHADDCVDVTRMPIYPDESVDAFLCSHVLEHIDDDRKAMRELYRILKPGGWGICMVPISLSLESTLGNPEWTTHAERWKYFSQYNHVRMYSKQGFIDRLTEAGFRLDFYDINHFGAETFQKCGINPKSVLYIVNKPQ